MNSRNENGQMFLKDKSEIIKTIKAWYDSGEIDNYTIYDDRVYYDDGEETYHEIY